VGSAASDAVGGHGIGGGGWGGLGADGGYACCPIILDLDGDGIEIIPLDQSLTFFDYNGDGIIGRTAWVGEGDGILVIDLDHRGGRFGDGVIDQAKEFVFSLWSQGPVSDMAALRARFDTNRDGVLSPADHTFSLFRVWVDQDGDAVTDPGELKTLAELGITRIPLTHNAQSRQFADGSKIWGTTDAMRADGSRVTVADAVLAIGRDNAGLLVADNGVTARLGDGTELKWYYGSGGRPLAETLGQQGYRAATIAQDDGIRLTAFYAPTGALTALYHHDGNGRILSFEAWSDGRFARYEFDAAGALSGVKLVGNDGVDTLRGGDERDHFEGRGGNDILHGGAGNDALHGEDGDDQLDGGEGDDVLFGGAGEDSLIGSDGDDQLAGGADKDTLVGGTGRDRLDGGAGDDVLRGDAGSDILVGGDGNDSLYGGADDDSLDGGDGDDELRGDEGDDRLDGGAGFDRLWGGGGHDQVAGGMGDDILDGEGGDDRLSGGEGNDQLAGGEGNDILDGGAGHDVLMGGAGDDELIGGGGNDVLDGGTGRDTAVLSGRRIDYDITLQKAVGRYTIVDKRAEAPDGTDLADIEVFRFSDREVAAADLDYFIGEDRKVAWTIDCSDGTRTILGWQVDDGTTWEIYVKHFDATGRQTSQTSFRQDGSRVAQAWDVNNTTSWTSYSQDYDGRAPHKAGGRERRWDENRAVLGCRRCAGVVANHRQM
jgi:Ca2+-binding RTX toxin-like protein